MKDRERETKHHFLFSIKNIFAFTIGFWASDHFQLPLSAGKNKLGVQLNSVNRKFKVVTGAQRAFPRAAELNRDKQKDVENTTKIQAD